MRAVFQWNLGTRVLELGKRTLVMGIVNVTPDSFSDGGLYLDSGKAVAHALQLLDEGADIVDIGGESTRPGASVSSQANSSQANSSQVNSSQVNSQGEPSSKSATREAVTAEEEMARVLPVVSAVKKQRPGAVISVDTYKAEVARAALAAGAVIINDVSALRWDPQMAKTVAEAQCAVVLMHMRGKPDEWRTLSPAGDVPLLVKRELRDFTEAAVLRGVRRERIVLDPGFGFGKSFEENYPLISRFQELQTLGLPLLVGVSRKSMIGRMLAKDSKDAPVAERLHGTLAVETALILKGAHIVRTHDVKATVDAARAADAILNTR